MSFNRLIKFWSEFDADSSLPRVHPRDIQSFMSSGLLSIEENVRGFEDYLHSERYGDKSDKNFHLSHRPLPYIGDLRKAKVILLQLNPGFDVRDYLAEFSSHASIKRQFKDLWTSNIRQDFSAVDYPLYYLDPAMCWHSGYDYWLGKLHGVISRLAELRGSRFIDCQKMVSETVAVVELVPYRSAGFKFDRLCSGKHVLPSVREVREAVSDVLANPGTRRPLIMMMRSNKRWSLLGGADLIVANPRSASLNRYVPKIVSRILA